MTQEAAPKQPKKPYTPPKLVRLGSVRDLTFGPSGTVSEAPAGKVPKGR